jgi:hypothetical protein
MMNPRDELTLEDAIRGLMTCRFRFDDVDTARRFMQKIAGFAAADEARVSSVMALDPVALHGLVVWCRESCEVFRKLDGLGRPWGRDDLLLLRAKHGATHDAAGARLGPSHALSPETADCAEEIRLFWGTEQILLRVRGWSGS